MMGSSRQEIVFTTLKKWLRINKPLPLPGRDAQFKMAPSGRVDQPIPFAHEGSPKDSAVIIFLKENPEGKANVLFILRKTYPGVHSGQIGFPGGKLEPGDRNMLDAAQREAYEEIGIRTEQYEIVQALSNLYVPASHFIIHPFLAIINEPFQAVLDEREVEELIEVPLHLFIDNDNIKLRAMTFANGCTADVPFHELDGKMLWGATAMIMSELIEIIRHAKGYG
jgi:8-oxo-dGTP pyrophosphatase MutT (NUDIX family)